MNDKTLLNAAGIIALVVGIICCLTLVGAIVGIPLIIGGNKFRQLSRMDDDYIKSNKDTILVWSIVFILLCTVSGVLGIIYFIGIENPNGISFSSKPSNSSKYNDLEKLNQLYKDKILTKEEYETEKERILNNK